MHLGNGKKRQPWLQRSLRTKDKHEAKRLAPPVLMEFDSVLADAEALTAERPLRTTLDRREIERIADFFYAHELAADEETRREGGSEAEACYGTYALGYARWRGPEREAGEMTMRQGIDMCSDQGIRVWVPLLAATQAETEAETGHIEFSCGSVVQYRHSDDP